MFGKKLIIASQVLLAVLGQIADNSAQVYYRHSAPTLFESITQLFGLSVQLSPLIIGVAALAIGFWATAVSFQFFDNKSGKRDLFDVLGSSLIASGSYSQGISYLSNDYIKDWIVFADIAASSGDILSLLGILMFFAVLLIKPTTK